MSSFHAADDYDGGTIETIGGETGTQRPSRFDEMIERTPWGRLEEGSLVMIATIFLVGGLVFPPVWLLALLFTKKSKKEYSSLQSVIEFIKLASFIYGFILCTCVYVAAIVLAGSSAERTSRGMVVE